MILSEQIKQLLGPRWTMKTFSSEHVRFSNQKSDDYFIEVKKQMSRRESSDRIHVTVPLNHVNFTTDFPCEMPAYEFIEDFVYDNMEKGIEFGVQMMERITRKSETHDKKRRRLSSTSCFQRIEPDWGWGWDSE